MDTLKAKIRHVPDFPKTGILFYDITPLLNDPQGFRDMIDALAKPYADKGIEQVVGIESRGFILGAAVANTLNAGFVPIRKPGKLPAKTHREDYALEVTARTASRFIATRFDPDKRSCSWTMCLPRAERPRRRPG